LINYILDALDDYAIELLTEVTEYWLCSQYIVLAARNSCSKPCSNAWTTDNDSDDESIKCKKCSSPIQAVLSAEDLKTFLQAIIIEDESKGPDGYFGYPILDSVAVDVLFEDLENVPNFKVERRRFTKS